MRDWVLREQFSDDLEKQLLFSRGIKNSEDAEKFLNPDYEKNLHDPFGLSDMNKAAERILEAIKNNERVVLFGDYDADGICGTAVFHDFFKKIGFENFRIYIPDKHKEGFGLNVGAIEELKKDGASLIVTIDCGVTDCAEIEEANNLGIETIVTDHHPQLNNLPPAFAIVDPRRNDDKYPFKSLCGAAVAFKVVEAVLKKGNFNTVEGWNKWLLDVVSIATVADMMPLVGENRSLVFYGLKVLKKTSRIGLLSLFDGLNIDKKQITEDDLAFLVAPKINTTSRMDHATLAFNLLTTEKNEEAKWLTERIIEQNKEQKRIVGRMFDEACAKIEENSEIPEVLVLGDENWPASFTAMVANKIIEKYNKPVFIWAKGESPRIMGSARRPNGSGINLVEVMSKAGQDFFLDYGGHAFAAGFTLKKERVGDFAPAIESVFKKIKTEEIKEVLWIDKKIDINDINRGLFGVIEKFAPFGKENEKPVFLFENLLVDEVKTFGNGDIHLRLNFKKQSGEKISAIGFFRSAPAEISVGKKINLAASVENSTFRGYNELRLRIVDLKPVK